MTSHNEPEPFIATASREVSGNRDAWVAFSNYYTEGDTSWNTGSGFDTGWIQINYGSPKKIDRLKIKARKNRVQNSLDSHPKNFSILGSNNGTDFTHIVSVDNQINWQHEDERVFQFDNNEEYTIYRIEISENNGGTYVTIGRVLFGYKPINKTLILSKNEYQKYGDNGWESVSSTLPNQAGFEEHGMDDLSAFDRSVQPVTGSPFVMTSDGALGEGKVFKGHVDLKKYFDLRNLSIK